MLQKIRSYRNTHHDPARDTVERRGAVVGVNLVGGGPFFTMNARRRRNRQDVPDTAHTRGGIDILTSQETKVDGEKGGEEGTRSPQAKGRRRRHEGRGLEEVEIRYERRLRIESGRDRPRQGARATRDRQGGGYRALSSG